MHPGISTSERIRIQNALMAELITACLGDKTKAIRLLEYERRRDPTLKTLDALDAAITRLCRDRGGAMRAAPLAARGSPAPGWAGSDARPMPARRRGPPDVNSRMALSFVLACAVVAGFAAIASNSMRAQVARSIQPEFPVQPVIHPPPMPARAAVPALPAPQADMPDAHHSSQVFRCTVNGKTVYADAPCGAPAQTKRMALSEVSSGFASPPKENLEDLTARRIASEQAYQRSMQAAPAPVPVDLRKIKCDDLVRRVNWLDAAARAPQSGQMQDWIKADKSRVQTRQFDLRC
jgi:hypothetical protein